MNAGGMLRPGVQRYFLNWQDELSFRLVHAAHDINSICIPSCMQDRFCLIYNYISMVTTFSGSADIWTVSHYWKSCQLGTHNTNKNQIKQTYQFILSWKQCLSADFSLILIFILLLWNLSTKLQFLHLILIVIITMV